MLVGWIVGVVIGVLAVLVLAAVGVVAALCFLFLFLATGGMTPATTAVGADSVFLVAGRLPVTVVATGVVAVVIDGPAVVIDGPAVVIDGPAVVIDGPAIGIATGAVEVVGVT